MICNKEGQQNGDDEFASVSRLTQICLRSFPGKRYVGLHSLKVSVEISMQKRRDRLGPSSCSAILILVNIMYLK